MITKSDIEALIDKLADNNLNTRSHPIMIGDVLAKLDCLYEADWGDLSKKDGPILHLNVMNLWRNCGFNKSLQQIFDDSGWEEGYIQDGKFFPSKCTVETERLKDPSAQSLGEYLLTIFKV